MGRVGERECTAERRGFWLWVGRLDEKVQQSEMVFGCG